MSEAPPRRPGRVEVRSGSRPHTGFGHDDLDADTELVVLRTADRHHWDGLLMRPRADHPTRSDTVMVVVHGSLGNYLGGVPRRLSFELVHRGFPILSVNTRMANFGVVYGGGLFDDTPLDLDAALDVARERGFGRIILAGYSLGASIVTHYQALRRPPEVVGLCAVAHHRSLPDSLARRWNANGARPSYAEVERLARRAGVGDGGRDDLVLVHRGAGSGGAPTDAEVWTLRAWWQARGPEARNAVAIDRIGQVTVPVAIIQAGDDPMLAPGDGAALAEEAARAGIAVRLEAVPGADHAFWGLVPEVAERAAAWADSLPRAQPEPAPPARRPPDRTARLLTIEAPDGTRHDAILERHDDATRARARARGTRTAVIHLHGNQGSCTVGALRFLRGPVADLGVPILTLDTRIGNVSQIFGTALLADVLMDVRAAARRLVVDGYDRIVVSGYSLGATAALYAAAHDLGAPVAGVVGLGAAWSLPEASRERMARCGAEPSYDALVEICRPYAEAPPHEDTTVVIRRMYLADDAPHSAGVYSARSWWHSRGPEAVAAQAHRHIGTIRAPILLVQGSDDVIVDPGDADRLAAHARQAGNDDVTVAMLEGAGHDFGDHSATAAAYCEWLTRIA